MTEALLVIDVQNGFCKPDGSIASTMAPLEGVDAAVRNTVSAVDAARRAGVPVIFTRHVYRPGYADIGRNFRRRLAIAEVGGLLTGTWDAALVDDLKVTEADLIVDKVRYDSFLQTSLDFLLRNLGIERLVLAGVVTNVCVETTARSAFMRDYDVTILGDCCAGRTRRLHAMSLEILSSYELASIADIGGAFRFQATVENRE